MAGLVPQGSENRFLFGAAAPPTGVIDHLQNFEFGSQSDTTVEEFYNPTDNASITTVGDLKFDGTGSGKWSAPSPTLQLIKTYSRTKALCYLGLVPQVGDGAGEYAPGRISRFRFTGGGVRQALGYQFSFVQDGAAANIGAGLE